MSETQAPAITPIAVHHFQFAGRKPTFILAGFECFILRAGTKGAYQGLARHVAADVGIQTERVFGEGAKARVTEAIRQAVKEIAESGGESEQA